jgi:pimeloyl-ACP methyl ester carboxylesterase
VAPRLAGSCRVLALDLPGFGRTKAGTRKTSVDANQRLLHRFLTDVAGEPAVLVGNSMGGMITVLEASAHPESVSGVVLIDPALPQLRYTRPDPIIAASFAAFALPLVGGRLLERRRLRYRPPAQVAQMLRLCCVDPGRVPADLVAQHVALAEERRSHLGVDAQFLLAARTLMRVLARPRSFRAKMRGLRMPVLLVHGAKDRLVPVGAARAAARHNPSWRFEIVDDVGHVPQLEAPDRTAEVILDWLCSEGAPAALRARHAGRSSDGPR